MEDFPKLVNKDTLPMYNIPFESHWSAYLSKELTSAMFIAVEKTIFFVEFRTNVPRG